MRFLPPTSSAAVAGFQRQFIRCETEFTQYFAGEDKRRRNSFRVAPSRNEMRFPRVAKAQPWAGIGERFQRYAFSDLSKVGSISTFCPKPCPIAPTRDQGGGGCR